jgi:hypothetical protein
VLNAMLLSKVKTITQGLLLIGLGVNFEIGLFGTLSFTC